MFSVVIFTRDVVGERMAGPGIRAWHFAEELRKHFPTTLVAKGSPRTSMRDAAVLIGQPARGFHRMRAGQRVVYDLFDPVLLELAELYRGHPSPRERVHLFAERWRLRRALRQGNLFLCATPQQRELYPGVADRLIEVPFGAEQNVPRPATRKNVVVWGGGTWEWVDPETAVAAVVKLNRDGVPCRLLFLGKSRPNPDVADRADKVDRLVAAGAPYVGANEAWVPYRERLAALASCKIAIMLHHPTPEAKYSIRIRLFDAIAASLPVVATVGGFGADLVEREGLGIVVPPDDANAVAAAIRRLLEDDDFYGRCVSSLERVRPRLAWDVVIRPLVEVLGRWKQES